MQQSYLTGWRFSYARSKWTIAYKAVRSLFTYTPT